MRAAAALALPSSCWFLGLGSSLVKNSAGNTDLVFGETQLSVAAQDCLQQRTGSSSAVSLTGLTFAGPRAHRECAWKQVNQRWHIQRVLQRTRVWGTSDPKQRQMQVFVLSATWSRLAGAWTVEEGRTWATHQTSSLRQALASRSGTP